MSEIGCKNNWEATGKEEKDKIPYEEIDEGIRKIIRLFNKISWLATTGSCSGHPTEEKYEWKAAGGISLEVYDEEKFKALVALFSLENIEDYEYFNISISKGYLYSTVYKCMLTNWGIGWFAMGKTKEECEKQLESIWCKLEYYLRKYLELEEKGILWNKYIESRSGRDS